MSTNTEVKDLNLTAKLLCGFVFSSNSLGPLVSAGLINIYIDDYGQSGKYKDCMFFLFNSKNKYYDSLERKITDFKSFQDFYDIEENRRMLVFKIGQAYIQDYQQFKQNNFDDFSTAALSVLPIVNFNFELDYSKEIYRYHLCTN